MAKFTLWLRWSWRDLRERWLQVVVIALIIALGTGVYVGLGSTTPWRLYSARASYDLLNMYDLRVTLTNGSSANQEQFLAAVRNIEHAAWIKAAEPRLIEPVFVHASHQGQEIWARGRLIGVDVSDGGPHVAGIYVNAGRALSASDDGLQKAILEYHFADYYHLPPQGQIELSGGVKLDYTGLGMSPEYFMIVTEEGGVWAQANFAAVFVPLATAQVLTHQPGRADTVMVTLVKGADREVVRREIEASLKQALPETGFNIKIPEDDTVYRLTFDTIAMNQEIYDIMIVLFMAGAMFGTFNLVSRMIESQRRQIGIGMALGMPPRLLVIRPLLVGAQIAILGAVFGCGIGLLVGKVTQQWLGKLLPMPVTGELFQTRIFLEAATLGFVLPFLATLYPVWRAVRVQPVDAIRTGHLVDKGNGWSSFLMYFPLPGKSFIQMPIRNLMRSPRRTLLTILGIAAAITTLISLVGVLDSGEKALTNIENEAFQSHPDRLTVILNNFYPIDSPQVSEPRSSPNLSITVPAIRVPGTARRNQKEFKVIIDLLDLDNPLWTPILVKGSRAVPSDMPGVLIAQNAAYDLGIGVGDTFVLEHPRRTGPFSYEMVKTGVRVTGLHADPWRTFVYMDRRQAGIMGLDGMANLLQVNPAAGISVAQAKNAMFQYPSVASVISVHDAVDSIEWVLNEALRFLSGVKIAVLALAFLVAFNSTNINIGERSREIATMFAFGLCERTVTRMIMLENLITGILGTLVGYGPGFLVLLWFCRIRMPQLVPETRYEARLSTTTLLLSVLIGVVVVALTPLLAIRKMRKMDIPSTLRVME